MSSLSCARPEIKIGREKRDHPVNIRDAQEYSLTEFISFLSAVFIQVNEFIDLFISRIWRNKNPDYVSKGFSLNPVWL
jgi:hypothetical protein